MLTSCECFDLGGGVIGCHLLPSFSCCLNVHSRPYRRPVRATQPRVKVDWSTFTLTKPCTRPGQFRFGQPRSRKFRSTEDGAPSISSWMDPKKPEPLILVDGQPSGCGSPTDTARCNGCARRNASWIGRRTDRHLLHLHSAAERASALTEALVLTLLL